MYTHTHIYSLGEKMLGGTQTQSRFEYIFFKVNIA